MASGQQKKIEKFWKWFQKNEAKYFNFETNRTKLVDAMNSELHNIHDTLTFLISPTYKNVRELTISAGGIKAGFPYVRLLVENAPKLERWKFIAFRQKTGVEYSITVHGTTISPKDVYFQYDLDFERHKINMYFFADIDDEKRKTNLEILSLLIDNALGEAEAATKLGAVEFLKLPTDANLEEYAKFTELPAIVDSIFENYFS